MTIELKLTPRKSALLAGHDNTMDVLVRAIGPQPPEGAPRRRRLNLALVIDCSGSMSGQPLDEAKRCAKTIVGQLKAEDFVSVVSYGSQITIVSPAGPAGDPAKISALIDGIDVNGMTALHDGWAAGAEQAALHVKTADVTRVLLLSDGNANEGLTDPAKIAEHCSQMAALGVSTSTYGLGESFNEDLMFAMARSGGGNAYYGKTAADLMTPFQQEFDLLQALYARNVVISLTAADGVKIQMANDLVAVGSGWRLADVAYGSEAWAVVRLRIPAALVAGFAGEAKDLLSCSLVWSRDGEQQAAVSANLALSSLDAAAYGAVAEDELVARRSQEVRFAEYQRDAGAAAAEGDWTRVDRILEKARKEAVGNEWLTASLGSLETYARERSQDRFAKEARFKSSRMMTRLAAVSEDACYSVSAESAAPSFLRRREEEGRGDGAG